MIISATAMRQNLYNIIDDVITTQKEVYVTTKRGNAVIIAEEDYNSMIETLYLLSARGMREKIVDGMNTPLDECVEDE